eukprot:evm.model.scf_244.7 EVM.evm.TU.scf_244.7   scf_244:54650-59374(-)
MWTRGLGRGLTRQLLRQSSGLEMSAGRAFEAYSTQAQAASLSRSPNGMLFCMTLAWRKVYSTAAKRSFSEDGGASPSYLFPTIFATLAASLLGTMGTASAESKKMTSEEEVMAVLADMDLSKNQKKFGPGNSMYIAPDNLRLVKKLNEGTFGQIWLGELRDGTHVEEVAVKLLSEEFLARECLADLLKAEALIFHRVSTRCHHVCRLYGVACKGDQVCLVMKLYKKSLHDLLRESQGHMPLADIQKYGEQVCKGLAELHEQGVIMQDLKPANVLIDDLDHAVLADFGMASFVERENGASVVTAAKGTPSYMAPEAWDPRHMGGMSTKTDMWSLACVIIELYTGMPPWHGLEVQAIAGKVKDEHRVPRVPRGLPAPLASALQKCLSFDPEERPQAREVLEVFLSTWDVPHEYEDEDRRYANAAQGFTGPPMMIQGSYWVPDPSAAQQWPIMIQGSLYVPPSEEEDPPMIQGSLYVPSGTLLKRSPSLKQLQESDKDLCKAVSRFAQIVEAV